MPVVAASPAGLLSFIRYAFMPNHLGYCGGNHQEVLFEHAAAGQSDQRLAPLLAKFSGALPYLQTIAAAHQVPDPFDDRVVEAYWLGNELLDGVDAVALYRSLDERFGRQLTGTTREQVLRKPPQGARPHHLFHVLDVYRHLEHEGIAMATMENCRVSWGQVTSIEGAELVVRRQPLTLVGNSLMLGEATDTRVLRSISDRGFADDAAVGDWVSVHWGWTCEVLDQRKLTNLRRWSQHHLTIANQTL
jgi:hydrogenase maturation factor